MAPSISLLSFLGGGVVLFSQGLFYPILLATYGFGISFYLLFLLAISIYLMLLYLMSLSYKALVPVIKGRLPLKRLMALTLLCQLVAVFTVGYAVKTGLTSYQRLKELEISKQAWQDRADYYQISFGLGDRVKDTENQNKWYAFAKEAIEEEQALYVKDNLFHLPIHKEKMNWERHWIPIVQMLIRSMLVPVIWTRKRSW